MALNIGIVGGGPAGLVTAINLAERCSGCDTMKGKIKIVVMDVRYAEDPDSGENLKYGGSRAAEQFAPNRRAQVVTLQQDCVKFLSKETLTVLFKNVNEHVWSLTSYNIPIREVEDRLLERAQQQDLKTHLKVEQLRLEPGRDEDLRETLKARFHLVVGADGSRSWVRKNMMQLQEEDIWSYGRDLALGVSFEIPEQDAGAHGLPLKQIHNVVRTLMQRRFLLNASSQTRSGFLNVQLTDDEFRLAVRNDKRTCVFARSPGMVVPMTAGEEVDGEKRAALQRDSTFKPQHDFLIDPEDNMQSVRLWKTVLAGLTLFGIEPRFVKSVIGIQLEVRYSRQIMNVESGIMCVLVGDAAFQTHFWPGRGMNSAIKEAADLAARLHQVGIDRAVSLQRDPKFMLHPGMRQLIEYVGFVTKLRTSELESRSLAFTCQTTKKDRFPAIVEEAMNKMRDVCVGALGTRLESWASIMAPRLKLACEIEGVINSALQVLGDESFEEYEIKIMAEAKDWPKVLLDEILPSVETTPKAPASPIAAAEEAQRANDAAALRADRGSAAVEATGARSAAGAAYAVCGGPWGGRLCWWVLAVCCWVLAVALLAESFEMRPGKAEKPTPPSELEADAEAPGKAEKPAPPEVQKESYTYTVGAFVPEVQKASSTVGTFVRAFGSSSIFWATWAANRRFKFWSRHWWHFHGDNGGSWEYWNPENNDDECPDDFEIAFFVLAISGPVIGSYPTTSAIVITTGMMIPGFKDWAIWPGMVIVIGGTAVSAGIATGRVTDVAPGIATGIAVVAGVVAGFAAVAGASVAVQCVRS